MSRLPGPLMDTVLICLDVKTERLLEFGTINNLPRRSAVIRQEGYYFQRNKIEI